MNSKNTLIILLFLASVTAIPAQRLDIRQRSFYGKNGLELSQKYQYYHDMWSEREVKHGRYSEWDKKANLRIDCFYRHDLKDSLYKSWYKNGCYQEISWWEDGYRQGKTQLFNRKGVLIAEYPYVEDQLQGIGYEYYKNGQLKKILPFAEGQLSGKASLFSKKGKLKKVLTYENGKLSAKERPNREKPVKAKEEKKKSDKPQKSPAKEKKNKESKKKKE